MSNIYKVAVKAWNEVEDREYEEVVFVYDTHFSTAVEQVEDYYRDNLCEIISVLPYEASMLCVSPGTAKRIEEELY